MNAPYLMPIALIDIDNTCWPRQALHQERIADFARFYADSGLMALDPLDVVALPNSRFLLVNGRHRYTALRRIESVQAYVQVLDCPHPDPVAFAYEYALNESARSALPLTRAEKHAAVLRLITTPPDRTDVAIAALVGVSSKIVQRTRAWLAQHPDALTDTDDTEPEAAPRVVRTTSEDVARTMVRQLQRLWDERSFGLSLGIGDVGKLGDQIGAAFVERVGADEAVAWTERFTTWAARAHATALAARQDDT
jgi:hypothetical protein